MKGFLIVGVVMALAVFVCCFSFVKQNEWVRSSSGDFTVAAIPRANKSDRTSWGCIRLVLMNGSGRTISAVQTDVSDFQKWAVGWMEDEDIVVIQSSDVGTQAFKASTNGLEQISTTPEMKLRALQLKSLKYGR